MKRIFYSFLLILYLFACTGCSVSIEEAQVVATTLPVYEFTCRLCENTPITVSRLISEPVSCLHDYSLSVSQAKAIERAEIIVISGGGLEDFLEDALSHGSKILDSSQSVSLHQHEEDTSHTDHGQHDPHIWLSPAYAQRMAETICRGLQTQYPQYATVLEENLNGLLSDLQALEEYANRELSQLKCRELITFHDGFSYLAEAFDLTILKAVEEESGSEASAKMLKELTLLIRQHKLPAIFTERNGSTSAAGILHAETGVAVYSLDMAISGNSYFEAMYHNIHTIKEALQ